MNGARASTLAAIISTNPVTQRNTASGISQRLPDPLCQSPRDYATCRQVVGDTLDQNGVLKLIHWLAVLASQPRQLLPIYRRTPKRMIRRLPVWIAEVDAIG